MSHPFSLKIIDLESIAIEDLEPLSEKENQSLAGGGIQCISAPCPGSESGGVSPKPPVYRPCFPPEKRLFPRINFLDFDEN